MLIGDNSKYLIEKSTSESKTERYHIPEHLHGEMEKDAKYLLILADCYNRQISQMIL